MSHAGDIDAVVFDLDGVLVDSETIWDDARREVVARHHGTWKADATRAMMGMSSTEWGAYLHDELGVDVPVEQIVTEVAAAVDAQYQAHLPLLPGAKDAVERLARVWPLGLASSSNRTIIERFLDASGLRGCFAVTVSSEEVARGKPAPDVYLAAIDRLGARPERTVAIEDSTNGLLAAAVAGVTVVAVPNVHFPPSADALGRASLVVDRVDEVTPDRLEAIVPCDPDDC
jgi:HAD superfamily hydrolase (TIGR01509 family)